MTTEERSLRGRRWGWWYVCEHRLRTMRAYLVSLIMGSIANPLFYLTSLGVGLGALIDAGTGSKGVAGVSYVTFVGPALLASAAITAGFEELSFPVMGGFKWTREFWSMNATVVSAAQVMGGVLLAACFRMVATVAIFYLFLLGFGAAPSPWSWLMVFSSLLAGLAMGSLVMAFAASLETDDGWFALVNRFVIAPLFLFSGTFYPLDVLPVGLQVVGWISPLWHATELGRMASFGLPVPPVLVAAHLVYPAILAGLGLALSARQFQKRLSK